MRPNGCLQASDRPQGKISMESAPHDETAPRRQTRVVVVGGGPAGLRAAEVASFAGACVSLWDRKPSVGRKFLVAGRGGLNITKQESQQVFSSHYHSAGHSETLWGSLIGEFGPEEMRDWALGLGVETFVASTRRVYPNEMKAAPLLRRWVERLKSNGVRFHMRHELRELSVGETLTLKFLNPERREVCVSADALVLAMGGASWPQTGSDGAWVSLVRKLGVEVADLQPANCGWEWSFDKDFSEQWQGTPIKSVHVCANGEVAKGELLVTRYGLEGGAIYQLGARLREMSVPCITVDFKPHSTLEQLVSKMGPIRRNFINECKHRWKLPEVVVEMLRRISRGVDPGNAHELAAMVKAFRIPLKAPRHIAEAISSAGGVRFTQLNEELMLTSLPGVFVAGEMLDWDAPTGGYLMQGCFATGTRAARGALRWLQR